MRLFICRALVAALVLGVSPVVVQAADPLPLNLGVMPSDGTSEGFYAYDQGFFKAAGLDVKLTVMNNGAATSISRFRASGSWRWRTTITCR